MSPMFNDLTTGNVVTAIQAGHPGILWMAKKGEFEEGDWIVTYPKDFEEKNLRAVFKNDDFKRRFKPLQGTKVTWDNFMDVAGVTVKKRKKIVR